MKYPLFSDNLQRKLLYVNHAVINKEPAPYTFKPSTWGKRRKANNKATDLEIGITTEIPAKTEKKEQ